LIALLTLFLNELIAQCSCESLLNVAFQKYRVAFNWSKFWGIWRFVFFLNAGDFISFIPGNCIMQEVDGHEIQPEQRWRVVLSNKHQKSFVQTLLDIFVALQSSQNDVDLGVEAI
jgi:hypothetical protein